MSWKTGHGLLEPPLGLGAAADQGDAGPVHARHEGAELGTAEVGQVNLDGFKGLVVRS
jgi:hypothetical protein